MQAWDKAIGAGRKPVLEPSQGRKLTEAAAFTLATRQGHAELEANVANVTSVSNGGNVYAVAAGKAAAIIDELLWMISELTGGTAETELAAFEANTAPAARRA